MPEEVCDGVLAWGADLMDENTLEQAARTAGLSFIHRPLALMPDAHWGMGATVGSVIATKDVLIPSAVGVDIGCGMAALLTNLTAEDLPDSLDGLHDSIESQVPAGIGGDGQFRSKNKAVMYGEAWVNENPCPDENMNAKATVQFGTLGSGNHFIEVCLDERDRVWIVLHSGSRGPGNKLAQKHIKVAKKLMQRWYIELPDDDLAFLPGSTREFSEYYADLMWSQKFALANRGQMLAVVLRALQYHVPQADTLDIINCHHNYTEKEQHHGKSLFVTRKGAIRAREGDMGIIPGSMGTATYITRGLGNPASYCSSSHGAGRVMSRRQAKKNLTVEDLRERMEGRAWNEDKAAKLLDEHPEAYKNIDAVMEAQKDLVEVQHTLRQVLNYKGA